jgi:phosphatidate cytidylyltransferase
VSLKDELKQRSIVAFLLIPFVVLLVYLGKIYFAILVSLAFLVALIEFLNLYKVSSLEKYYTSLLFLLAIAIYYFGQIKWLVFIPLLFFLSVPIFWNRGISIINQALSFFILLYAFLGAVSALIIRQELGFKGILFFLAIIWIFDTMAYLCGYFFGRHKLAVKISPKKTVEGYIYGIIFTLPFGYILHILKITPFKDLYYSLAFTLIISVLSQIGDLVESSFKREVGVKDSSNLFPGHGGMLDRIDSIMFTAPYFAFITWILGLWK